ncbi:hypothetical protein ACFWNQ_24935 [Streptomyces virginiae]|uniref:hypothetical protein n=1 Tax=Streptomyces virginiae TaxID=1961 RepID=UPI00365E6CAC
MPDIDARLAAYFETRAQQREQDIDDRLAQLTPRERSLIRDAAVMGYVQGRMDERANVGFPKDVPILRGVVFAALRDENFHVLRGATHQYTEPSAPAAQE